MTGKKRPGRPPKDPSKKMRLTSLSLGQGLYEDLEAESAREAEVEGREPNVSAVARRWLALGRDVERERRRRESGDV